jgi:hypothetical protein
MGWYYDTPHHDSPTLLPSTAYMAVKGGGGATSESLPDPIALDRDLQQERD